MGAPSLSARSVPALTGYRLSAWANLTYGSLGSALALLAITLPPLLVLPITSRVNRVERYPWAQGAMRGFSIAVISLLISVIWTIGNQPGMDWRGPPIGIGAFGLALSQKVNTVVILALAGGVGYLLYR